LQSPFNPFNPFDPFDPYFQFVDASPSGGCRSGSAEGCKEITALDETTQTDTDGHERIEPVRGRRAVRVESGISLVGN
jgi:hypothetical protein